MFHKDIEYISYKTKFLISNILCQGLYLENFKGDFLNI